MTQMRVILLLIGFVWIARTGAAVAKDEIKPVQDPAPVAEAMKKPALDPGLRVDVAARRIEIDVKMAEPNRVLEYLLVVEGTGPAYESMLTTRCEPEELHLALLMIGLTAPEDRPGFLRGDPGEVHGEKADLWLEWTAGTGVVRRRVESLLKPPDCDCPFPARGWTFLPFRRGHNKADAAPGAIGAFHAGIAGNLISILHDPYSILTHPDSQETKPDFMPVVRPGMPKPGTALKLILEPIDETRLVERALKNEDADKAHLNAVLAWARKLDGHRAAWKAHETKIDRLTVAYEKVKANKKKSEEAYATFQQINLAKQARYTSQINTRRAEYEMTGLRLRQAIQRKAAEPEPNIRLVEHLSKQSADLADVLILQRLLVEREDANLKLAHMEMEIEELAGADKPEAAEKVRAQRNTLSARAEVLDLKIDIIQYKRRIEDSTNQIETLRGEIEFFKDAIGRWEDRLKEIEAVPDPKKQEK